MSSTLSSNVLETAAQQRENGENQSSKVAIDETAPGDNEKEDVGGGGDEEEMGGCKENAPVEKEDGTSSDNDKEMVNGGHSRSFRGLDFFGTKLSLVTFSRFSSHCYSSNYGFERLSTNAVRASTKTFSLNFETFFSLKDDRERSRGNGRSRDRFS